MCAEVRTECIMKCACDVRACSSFIGVRYAIALLHPFLNKMTSFRAGFSVLERPFPVLQRPFFCFRTSLSCFSTHLKKNLGNDQQNCAFVINS
jgi:hypothetical protein